MHFILGDAETIQFDTKFDAITCQYALFFFPNAQKVLKNMKKFLKKNGIIAMSVHGKHNVPYFDSILETEIGQQTCKDFGDLGERGCAL